MSKKIRLAINGFGRIGRQAFKIALEKPELEVVGINDLTSNEVLAHLLKYDTAYGKFGGTVESDENHIVVDGKAYPVTAEKDPSKLPWKDLAVDVVIESTGFFTTGEKASAHLESGAKRVIISAPAKDKGLTKTFVLGVNDEEYSDEAIISNASCTTNCVSPVAAVMHAHFGIEKAMMTTVHSYTANQNLVDGPPRGGTDLRRARAAAMNIVPTTTGAAIAATEAIPELKDKFDGMAIRVPTLVGSLTDFTMIVKKDATEEDINEAFRKSATNPIYKGVLEVVEEPIVSSDIIGNPASSIVDLSFTKVVGGNMVKVLAWYDNECGYSHRLVEQVISVGKTL